MSGRPAEPVTAFKDGFASDEERAAYCAALYLAYSKGGDEQVPMSVLSEGVVQSQRLLEKYPASIELLTLRLGYGHVELETRFSPFLEAAYPVIHAVEAGRVDGPWKEALVTRWYWAFWNMAANYSEQEAQKRRQPGYRPYYPRRQYLFDPNSATPTDEDVLMWRAVFADGASRVAADKARWAGLLNALDRERFKTDKKLSLEQARARLDMLLTQYSSMIMIGGDEDLSGRRPAPQPKSVSAPTSQSPPQAGAASRLSPEDRRELARLEGFAGRPSDDWEVHKQLIEFYASHRMRDAEAYPPSRFIASDAPLMLQARAYYLLVVRPGGAEQRPAIYEEALRLADEAIAKEPRSGRAHALRAFALVRQGKMEEAKAAVAKALELDPECAEAVQVRHMLDALKSP